MLLALLTAGLLAQAPTPELTSPLGRVLAARPDTAGAVARAESAAARNPGNVDTLIALGQAFASVWRYRDAIATYTRGIAIAPERAALYRHRGHRYISTRQFARALEDLERAARLDSTSYDIWYHLGLAYYLTGRFAGAAAAYERCRAVANTVDNLVAVTDWRWMALQRAGRKSDATAVLAEIRDSMPVAENAAYYLRLLFYKGLRTEADVRAAMARDDLAFATVGYGLANWYLVRGDTTRAVELFRRIVESPYWPAFGYIASEVELQRR